MRKEDRVIAKAAADAKVTASKVIDATANLAVAAVTKAADEVHRAGAALTAAGEKLEAAVDGSAPADARPLKLVD